MFHFISKYHFHESIAIAVLFASAVTLQVAWMANLLVARVPVIRAWYDVVPSIGPISGLYLKSLLTFVVIFILSALYLRGKDCSMHRKNLLGFFLFSVFVFFIMTIPFIYQYSAVIGS